MGLRYGGRESVFSEVVTAGMTKLGVRCFRIPFRGFVRMYEFPEADLLRSLEEPSSIELILLLQLLSPLRLLLKVLFGASAKADGRQAFAGIDCAGFLHLSLMYKNFKGEKIFTE